MSDDTNEWNDGYILEGMDRCHTIMLLLDQLLDSHPSVIKAGQEIQLEVVSEVVMEIYQAIGRLEEEQ